MVFEFVTKIKMSTGFFYLGIIMGNKKRLLLQRSGNGADCFRDSNVIPEGMVIGVCFKCMIERVKRGIGQSGNHMAVGKAYRAENVQSQNGDNQQEQVSGGRFGSISKIILKI